MPMPPEPSWSQSGEDRILHALFSNFTDRTTLTYADLGAAFPDSHNNSFLAYSLGGTGVLVEADPSYASQYQATRPRDVYVNAAVVPKRLRESGTVTFHIMQDPGWSTASEDHLATAASLGKGPVKSSITIPCLTINEVLMHNPTASCLDFISIDIEGLDTEVLAELDVERFEPKAIIAENAGGRPIHKEIMEGKGYEMYAFTFINSLYIRRHHFRL